MPKDDVLMKSIIALLVLSATLVACSSKDSPEVARDSAVATRQEDAGRQRYLAYEHTIAADIDEVDLKPVYEKVIATCNSDNQLECTVLDASITSGRFLSAKLRLRAKPEGVRKLTALVSAGGKVSSQSTHVEDLAKPVTDVKTRLAMLENYRTKLLELQRRPNNDIDSLIKIAEKLAAVQSDLERARGESAHLLARVNLEILTVSLSSRASRSFWSPIAESLHDFPANLSSGVSTAIVGVAYVLPWLFVLLIGFVLIRLAWRKFRRQ